MLALLVSAVLCTQCARPVTWAQHPDARDGAVVTVAAGPLPGTALRGRPDGKVAPFEYRGGDLRAAVLAQPAPEVWLSFGGSAELGTAEARVELPAEARRLCEEQWAKGLAARYDWEMVYSSALVMRDKMSVVIASSSQKTSLELRKIAIDAPDGRRLISPDEANDLAHFVGKLVAELVERAKAFDPDRSTRETRQSADVKAAVEHSPAETLRGRAEGQMSSFEQVGRDLWADVLASPFPEVWLSFDASPALGTRAARIELPPEAQELLRKHWEVALASMYAFGDGGKAGVTKRGSPAIELFTSSSKTVAGLAEVVINAPGGPRRIRPDEAYDLTRFVSQAASELLMQARGFKAQM